MDKKKLLIIKLGGSVITDKNKPFTARRSTIFRLGKEIEKALKKLDAKVIITHGSGSFGHTPAAKYQTHLGNIGKNSIKGLVETANAASTINEIVMQELKKTSLNTISFEPRSFIYSNKMRKKNAFLEPIRKALSLDLIPVIYGDVVFDQTNGFCIYSADRIITILVSGLNSEYKIENIIYCGDTDGVYDCEGKIIPKITPKNFKKYKKDISGSKGIDVTGGMLYKVEESLVLATKNKIVTFIINGKKDGILKDILEGKKVESTKIVR